MSRRIYYAAVFLLALISMGLFATTTQADVTGSFGTHIMLIPQSTASEFSLIDFDVQNDLNVSMLLSGLTTTFHSHFGIAGIEDIIITMGVTLGALEMNSRVIFARFPFASVIPFYPSIHFVQKRVQAQLDIAGVTFSSTTQFEDTAAFISQTPGYAFGSVLSLEGETPSGVSIETFLGICMEQAPVNIKKHPSLSSTSVDPDCATEPKPDMTFNFETLVISGVPLAPNVLGSSLVNCVTFNACLLATTFSFSGGVVPFSTTLTFTNILELTMGNTILTLFQGPATLSLVILPTGTIGSISLSINATLNADANSASFSLSSSVSPGIGLTNATAVMTIQRSGLTVGTIVVFGGGPPATFSSVTFEVEATVNIIAIETTATFTPTGLSSADIFLTINF